jgi:hypothetical protein
MALAGELGSRPLVARCHLGLGQLHRRAAPAAARCASCGAQLPPAAKFCPECAQPVSVARPFASPETYTPRHLAERILTSKAALEGERKQVTVLFADLKGSMELLAESDPEDARKLLDPECRRS